MDRTIRFYSPQTYERKARLSRQKALDWPRARSFPMRAVTPVRDASTAPAVPPVTDSSDARQLAAILGRRACRAPSDARHAAEFAARRLTPPGRATTIEPLLSLLTSGRLSSNVLLESILHQGEARGLMRQSPEDSSDRRDGVKPEDRLKPDNRHRPEGDSETQRSLKPERKTKPREATRPEDRPSTGDDIKREHRPAPEYSPDKKHGIKAGHSPRPEDSPSKRDGVTPEHRPRAEETRNMRDGIRPEDSIREDAELIWSALQGKESAFAKLLKKYRRQVYSLALRMLGQEEDAEDTAQEAFMRAFQSLESCDRSRPFLRWIYKITYNLCVDRYRRKRPFAISLDQTIGEEETQIELVDGSPSPEELVGRREEQRMLTELLHSLPSRYRVVVVLRHQEDLSYEAIAEILGLPLGTVKARMHRAHNMLRKKLRHRQA